MRSNATLSIPLVWLVFAGISNDLSAQQVAAQHATAVQRPAVIEIGQPIAETLGVLRSRRVQWSDAPGQFTLNEDSGYLWFDLDKEHCNAEIFYSKSRQAVTGIYLVYYPAQKHSRSDETSVSAKGVRLDDDGSYAVHFSPPVKEEQRVPPPAPQYPSSSR